MPDPLATNNLGLPYIAAAQAQKHVTHNEALRKLDTLVQLAVLDSTLTAPPGSPAAGDRYIVAASATDAWDGHDGAVATWVDGIWEFASPEEGWLAFDIAGEAILVWLDGAWAPAAAAPTLGAIDMLGVNATADTTNRLAVRSDAVLFTAVDDADGGTGDVRFVVNKETDADTASLVFQSGFSGRAEVGLAGDTDFVLKVSPDGSAWTETIRIDKDTGLPTILYDNGVSGLAATNVQDAIDEVAAGGGGGGGAIVSVFGRTGAVAATASDYDASQVDNDSGVSGATVKDALDALASAKQAADGDLTAIAALSPSNDDVIQRKAGAWTNRTMAQVKTDLALTKSDVGLGSVSNDAQLKAASNLSDVGSASTARTNLGLGDSATKNTGTTTGTVAAGDDSRITGAAQKASNLSDLGSASTARTNLGLGDSATKSVGTSAGTVAAGDDSRIAGAAQKSSNLSDLGSVSTARTNLGLAIGSDVQGYDSDLAAIAALAPSNDDVVQRKAGAWTNRTMAQVKTDLALTKSDVGLSAVTNDAQLKAASNLSDLGSATTARTNLGLGDAATKNTGTSTGTLAAGDDSRITGAAQKSSNLSDLGNAATAFGNIKQDATTSATGVVELATVAEAGTGTDTTRAVTPAGLFPAQATVASASTCNIGAAASTEVSITGTTTITAFDSVAAGIVREGVFAGVLTLTHNATSLKLPGGANITTATNDRFRALSLGSGNWIVLAYQKADGTAVAGGGGTAATQSEQEAASSTTAFVSPGTQKYHPSAAKCWAYITISGGTPTLSASYNVTSITDTATGRCTVTIATDFSSANWSSDVGIDTSANYNGGNYAVAACGYASKAAGSIILEAVLDTPPTAFDPGAFNFQGYGDQ